MIDLSAGTSTADSIIYPTPDQSPPCSRFFRRLGSVADHRCQCRLFNCPSRQCFLHRHCCYLRYLCPVMKMTLTFEGFLSNTVSWSTLPASVQSHVVIRFTQGTTNTLAIDDLSESSVNGKIQSSKTPLCTAESIPAISIASIPICASNCP